MFYVLYTDFVYVRIVTLRSFHVGCELSNELGRWSDNKTVVPYNKHCIDTRAYNTAGGEWSVRACRIALSLRPADATSPVVADTVGAAACRPQCCVRLGIAPAHATAAAMVVPSWVRSGSRTRDLLRPLLLRPPDGNRSALGVAASFR